MAENDLPRLTLEDYGIATPEDVDTVPGFINPPKDNRQPLVVEAAVWAASTVKDTASRVAKELPKKVVTTVFDAAVDVANSLPIAITRDARGLDIEFFPQNGSGNGHKK